MSKKDLKLIGIFTIFLMVIFVISLNLAYNNMTNNISNEENTNIENLRIEDREDTEIIQTSTAVTIKDVGEVVYQYYYTFDSVTKEVVENIPQYLVGATREQTVDIFPDWQLLLFSENKVILRKFIDANSDEIYYISDVDGYIAIFNENERKQLKLIEQTTIPINIFPQFEQEQLQLGIEIIGKENLVKIMSDFST